MLIRIFLYSSFFEIKFKFIYLLVKVNEEFGVELTLRDLFAAPTVYAMARLLDKGINGAERISTEPYIDLDQQVETYDVKDNVMDLQLRAFLAFYRMG